MTIPRMSIRLFSVVLLAAAFAFALVGCGADEEVMPDDEPPVEEPAPDEEPIDTFEIAMTDFELEPVSLTVAEPGTYVFRALNDGANPHALAISGPGVEESTETISPGEAAELVVRLEAGEYELWCPVANHRELGMEATVGVGDEAEAAEDEAEDEPAEHAGDEVDDYDDGLGY